MSIMKIAYSANPQRIQTILANTILMQHPCNMELPNVTEKRVIPAN